MLVGFYVVPPTKGRLHLVPDPYGLRADFPYFPPYWFRLWQRIFLGWTWERIDSKS
jgi:hypothetical protein